jgi:hypothetical protein
MTLITDLLPTVCVTDEGDEGQGRRSTPGHNPLRHHGHWVGRPRYIERWWNSYLFLSVPFILGELRDNTASLGFKRNYPGTLHIFFWNKTVLFVKIESKLKFSVSV